MRCDVRFLGLVMTSMLTVVAPSIVAKDVTTLEINAPAPELDLPGVDGRNWKLSDFADAKLLVIVFIANHCPTV